MELKVYAELGEDDGCLLYIFDPPGMLVRSNSFAGALEKAPEAAKDLFQLLGESWRPCPDPGEIPKIVVAEEISRRGKVANGNTSVTFLRDKVPPEPKDVLRFLKVLDAVRGELLGLEPRIPTEGYGFKSLPYRKTIGEQLGHIAACDRWYLSRLWKNLPRLPKSRDVWDKLKLNRERVIQKLLSLTPGDLAMVVRTEGEVWTCGKLLRRLMYHERFHLETILRDLKFFEESRGPIC